jgi:hypothetical protein
VVPNLRRLGLLTERTEDQYRRIGVVYDDRFESSHDAALAS